ncbi:MAG: acetyl-CoA carboxylase biotin carboxyl carrier protein subunit [Rickettsiales bacterium]
MNTTLHIDGTSVTLESLSRKSGEVAFELNGKSYHFRSHHLPDGSFVLEHETSPDIWQRINVSAWRDAKNMCHVQLGGVEAKISEQTAAGSQGSDEGALSPTAPMPGVIRKVMVSAGETVTKGQALVVMEAMKLQTTLSAGADATVEEVLVAEGDQVDDGDELVRLVAAAKEEAA